MVVCKFFQQGNCLYGNNCRFDHIYGSKYSYRAPQSQTTRSGRDTFSTNASSELGLKNTASSLFRSAVQNVSTYQNASNHTFVQSQPTRPSVFDRLGPPHVINQNNQAKTIFAQANSVFSQTQPATNVFHTQSNAKSLFAQATKNIFGQPPPNTMIIEPQKTLQSSNYVNIFQINNRPSTTVFDNNSVDKSNEDGVYSKMEELSPSDIEAFESEDFKLGFIPELPPPLVLCG